MTYPRTYRHRWFEHARWWLDCFENVARTNSAVRRGVGKIIRFCFSFKPKTTTRWISHFSSRFTFLRRNWPSLLVFLARLQASSLLLALQREGIYLSIYFCIWLRTQLQIKIYLPSCWVHASSTVDVVTVNLKVWRHEDCAWFQPTTFQHTEPEKEEEKIRSVSNSNREAGEIHTFSFLAKVSSYSKLHSSFYFSNVESRAAGKEK